MMFKIRVHLHRESLGTTAMMYNKIPTRIVQGTITNLGSLLTFVATSQGILCHTK